jgi:hypothetical protein
VRNHAQRTKLAAAMRQDDCFGHEYAFPPPRLSAGYRFRKETIAGVRHNGRDAPKAVIVSVSP